MSGTDRFDFSTFDNGVGNSGFGQAHGRGVDLRPELPQTTPDLIGIDLSHRIDVADFASAAGGAAGKPGGGGGGGGGAPTFADYTTSIAGSAYNITIQFKGTWTQDLHDVFVASANRLASLIVGDVQDVNVIMKGGMRLVDDILISAELKAIDGAGGILGQAGPTSIRSVGSLPATATMQFDSADAADFFNQGLFGVIVTHEMLHCVGFGTIWPNLGLVSGSTFTGANALAVYNDLLPAGAPDASGVPLETGGGSGTAGSHWSEAVFDHELMTGYIDALPDPLSRMTVASLQDLGYQVNYGGPIDGYVLS